MAKRPERKRIETTFNFNNPEDVELLNFLEDMQNQYGSPLAAQIKLAIKFYKENHGKSLTQINTPIEKETKTITGQDKIAEQPLLDGAESFQGFKGIDSNSFNI